MRLFMLMLTGASVEPVIGKVLKEIFFKQINLKKVKPQIPTRVKPLGDTQQQTKQALPGACGKKSN